VAAAAAKAEQERLRAKLAQCEKALAEALRAAERAGQRAATAEERLKRHAEAEAAQNKTFERLMAQVEANLAAATARAVRAEQRVAELELELAAERARCAQLEGTAPTPAEFPDWPAARRCIVTQRAQLSQARAKAREASEQLRQVTDTAATHLVEVARCAKQLREISSLMLSYDRLFEADDGSSALPPL